jgi:hypothetical protein
VAATNEQTLATLQLALQLVHHRVECRRRIAGHRTSAKHVSAATPDERDLANLAFGNPAMRLLDKSNLGPLDGLEIAVEMTNLLVYCRSQWLRDLDVSVADGDVHSPTLPFGRLFSCYGSDVADLVFVPTSAWRCEPSVGCAPFRTYF